MADKLILYRKRQAIRAEHAEWSKGTFGDVGPVGPLKHLSKEALEAAENPTDLSEWADMQFLLWDAQRRAGITDDQIVEAMAQKLPILKARKWPVAKDGEPVLHVKEDELRISDPIHVTAITALAEAGIHADIQELLVAGDPTRGVPPGALAKAIAAISGNASTLEAADADRWLDVNDKHPRGAWSK